MVDETEGLVLLFLEFGGVLIIIFDCSRVDTAVDFEDEVDRDRLG